MELTNHSAGSLTSESYVKRWIRRNEQLADAEGPSAKKQDKPPGGEEDPHQLFRGCVPEIPQQHWNWLPQHNQQQEGNVRHMDEGAAFEW